MAEFTLIPLNQADNGIIFTVDKVLSFNVIWTKKASLNHYVYVESKLCPDKIFANKIQHGSGHKLVHGTIGRVEVSLDYDGSYLDELTITIKDNIDILHQEIFIVDTIGVVSPYEIDVPKPLVDNGTVTLSKSPLGTFTTMADVYEILHKDGSSKSKHFENLDYVSESLAISIMSNVTIEDGGYKNIGVIKVDDKPLQTGDDLVVIPVTNYYASKQEIDTAVNTYQFTKHDHSIMELCALLAAKSTCNRAKMGAVIAIDEATFITGYNGTLKGFPNNCDDEALVCSVCNVPVDETQYVVGEKHCKKGFIEKRPKSNTSVVHAETNAILRAAKHGISVVGKTMYMTTSPCPTCANNIVQSGISRIVYADEHDDLGGLNTLRKAGVAIVKYER